MAEVKKLVQVHRADGSLSRTQILNMAEFQLLTITGIVVEVLPAARDLFVEHPQWFLIAMAVSRAVNMYLRATTTQELKS